MNIIEHNSTNEIIIKKSKFISKLYKISNINEVTEIINNLKKEYKDATHICYGYIIDGNEKYNDDGEPSGTAGFPILNILKKNNLNKVLAIVIRYFGGIKLGSGGLIRVYAKVTKENLKLTSIISYKEMITITLKTDYDNIKNIDRITKDYKIQEKSFNNDVIYKINIPKEKEQDLNIRIKNTKIVRI